MLAGQIIGVCFLGLARSDRGVLGNLMAYRHSCGSTVFPVVRDTSGCATPNCSKCAVETRRCYKGGCGDSYEKTKAFRDLQMVYQFCECLGEKMRRCGEDDDDHHHHNHIHGHKRGHKKHNREREEEIRRMKIKAVRLLYGIRSVIPPKYFEKYNKACEHRKFGKCYRILKECLGQSPNTCDLSYYSDSKYWSKKFAKMGNLFKSFCFYDKNVDCVANSSVWELRTKYHMNPNGKEFFIPKSCISPYSHVFATTPTEDLGYMCALIGADLSWARLVEEYKKKIMEIGRCARRDTKLSTEAIILHLRLKFVSFLTITFRTAYFGMPIDVKQHEVIKILNYMLNGTFDWFLSAFAGSLKAQYQN